MNFAFNQRHPNHAVTLNPNCLARKLWSIVNANLKHIAKLLFVVFLVLAVISFAAGALRGRAPV